MSKALSVGFDYGTSHCSMGLVDRGEEFSVNLLPLSDRGSIVPSTLYTPDRNLIYRFVAEGMNDEVLKNNFVSRCSRQLMRAKLIEEEWGLANDTRVFFGSQAFEEYSRDPSEGYYVRSPKSFLGSFGLNSFQLDFIEQIVAAMMIEFKSKAQQHCQCDIDSAVIGRPINFQGLKGEESNRQAIDLLTRAAKTSGFKHIEFLYEPLAAGIDFESRLHAERVVLVVDIGGGTTDCSVIRMGPDRRQHLKRDKDFLAHTGRRIGGNDFDIALAYKLLMPLFGSKLQLNSGKPIPSQPFWQAVEINNAGSQVDFYAQACGELLQQLYLNTNKSHLLSRFIRLRDLKQNFQLVAAAERTKLALSDQKHYQLDMSFIEHSLEYVLNQEMLTDVFRDHIHSVITLTNEAIRLAGCQPDCVYITGGMGKSPLVRQALQQHLGSIELLSGDYFSSVTAGLAKWADKIFS